MKKLLILAVALLVAVAFAAPSFAADTTFNGQYRIRAWNSWNFYKHPSLGDSNKDLYTGYFDQRFRLTITHTRSEFLKAVIQIDLVEDTWGQQRNFRMNNAYPKLYGKEWRMNNGFVRKAFIQFNIPKVGTFTVGKQPVLLGYGLVLSDSWGKLDGLRWANKWGPVAVSAMYFKYDDNASLGVDSEYYNRDTDIWALDVVYTPNGNHKIELFGGYAKYGTGFPYSHRSIGAKFDPAELVHANVGFVGIAYTGEIANMITLKGEFDYLFGRANLENWGGGFADDALITGYNLYVDASWHNDMMRAGLAFVHGSGDTREGVQANHFNANFITADEFSFANIIAAGAGKNGLNDTWGNYLGLANDVENLTALKLYFEAAPTEKLTVGAAVIWARWTEKIDSDWAYRHPAGGYTNFNYVVWDPSYDMGWEIDLNASYKIMDGLTYSFTGGVLFTGDSWDYDDAIDGSHENWGPIWSINNTLTYEF